MTQHAVLLSHGHLAEELKKTTEMIMGDQPTLHALGLKPEEGPEEFQARLEAELEGLEDFVIFVDLQGGTPCNVASRLLLDGQSFRLYAGMNLPLVIAFINGQYTGEEADLLNQAKEGLVDVTALLGR